MRKIILKQLNQTDEKIILKQSTFWNMVGSILNAFMTALLMLVVTRFCGVNIAGMFSIASTIAYQCLSIGQFNVRNLQSSDVKKEFSYWDYFNLRIISSIAMYLMLIYYAFFSGYSTEKSLIILSFGLFKSIDSFEDVVHGEYHRYNRLDIGAMLQTIRLIISFAVFILGIMITKNLVFTCSIVTIISCIIFIYTNYDLMHYYIKNKININILKIKKLFFISLPLCISGFIHLYIANAPKYAIDNYLNDTSQTFFGILSVPMFAINLLSTIIYRPLINKISLLWNGKKFDEFKKMVLKQVLVIVGITLFIMLGGYIIGLTLLEVIYGIELKEYMSCFMVLLLGGGFNTIVGYMLVLLTILREQNKITVMYVLVLGITLLISELLVSNYGILGASLLYLQANVTLMILFSIIIFIKYKKTKK